MQQQAHQQTTRTTTRKSTGGGFLFGFVFLAVSIGLLFWNEGNAVRQYTSLQEGLASVVELDDTANVESKLVHMTGRLTTQNAQERPIVMDAEFGVAATGVYLHRIVEMLQWKEKRHDHTYTEDGQEKTDVTYTYKKSWSAQSIDSDAFHDASYVNPSYWEYKSKKISAPSVFLRGYRVPDVLLGQISTRDHISLDDASRLQMASILELSLHAPLKGGIPALKTMDIHHNEFMSKEIPSNGKSNNQQHRDRANIGDLRVRFQVTPASAVSVLAMAYGGALHPYTTKSGDPIVLLEEGVMDAAAMIDRAQALVTMWAWGLRVVGLVLAVVGFNVLLQPVVDLAHLFINVPLLGTFVAAAASWSGEHGPRGDCDRVGVVSVSLPVSQIQLMNEWWWWSRPLVALGLVLVAITPYIGMLKLSKAHVKLAVS
ncbi:hypothetical protein DYB37_005657 [Aphanomyces astaci]|uniref:Transmembrane protein 43 n=1 Tax=Aphanomyces astaci TaxID=112090 RepID=A0A3R7A3R5_APHAT|nr:hypothetical protein DYB35_003129 [Aphanomyces astaci]RHZ25394.1 hypothetical protein DYB37_005657 [Aphanomyces astaci]